MAQATDRRPIAARERLWAKAIAAWLARKQVSPNAISIFGLLCGCAAGLVFAATWSVPELAPALWIVGAICIQLRLAANMFDGMVAIARGAASALGELYNEVPDRLSDSVILIGFGTADGSWGLGTAAALAAMSTAYIRALGKSVGAGSDFSGPMAKQQRMFIVTLAALWLALTPLTWHPVVSGVGLVRLILLVVIAGALMTALRRLARIARTLRRAPS